MPGVVLIQSLYVVQIDLCQSHQDYGSRARAHTRMFPYNITGRCKVIPSDPAPGVTAIPGLGHNRLRIGIVPQAAVICDPGDRKSTRVNSSHVATSSAVFCLKTKNYTGLR